MNPTRTVVALAIVLLGAPLPGQAGSDVSWRAASGLDGDVSATGADAAVLPLLTQDSQLGGGLQQSLHQGIASAAQQTLHGSATISSFHPSQTQLFDASTYVGFFKLVQVLPGSSGLEWGAPVRIGIDLTMSGNIAAGELNPLVFPNLPLPPGNVRRLGSVDASIDYEIVDLDGEPPCGECGEPTIFEFGYSGRMMMDVMNIPWAGAEEWYETRWRVDGHFAGAQPPTSGGRTYEDPDPLVWDKLVASTFLAPRRYVVETFVGHTLQISGDASFLVQAMGQAVLSQSTAYFMHTFDAGLVSDIGLAFSGETGGIFPARARGLGAVAAGRRRAGGASPRQRRICAGSQVTISGTR
jgi:hypothetical protein